MLCILFCYLSSLCCLLFLLLCFIILLRLRSIRVGRRTRPLLNDFGMNWDAYGQCNWAYICYFYCIDFNTYPLQSCKMTMYVASLEWVTCWIHQTFLTIIIAWNEDWPPFSKLCIQQSSNFSQLYVMVRIKK